MRHSTSMSMNWIMVTLFSVAVGPTLGLINNLKYTFQIRNNNTENFRDSIFSLHRIVYLPLHRLPT